MAASIFPALKEIHSDRDLHKFANTAHIYYIKKFIAPSQLFDCRTIFPNFSNLSTLIRLFPRV